MPRQTDATTDVPMLSAWEAFLAMSDYLWRYAQTAGDDLITLLGDTNLREDGQPTDRASWGDFLESVERIKAGQPPRSKA